MKILFTIFTPPYAQGYLAHGGRGLSVEEKFLRYKDWFGVLRSALAASHEVKLISLTKEPDVVSIWHDGYESIFFPVLDAKVSVADGRWDLDAQGITEWVSAFDPDVIHIVGSGHKLSLEILQSSYVSKCVLWERMKFMPEVHLKWDELNLCARYILPTIQQRLDAENYLSKEKLLSFPMGVNVDLFAPDKSVKDIDVFTVGNVGSKRKKLAIVLDLVKCNSLSWIAAGSVVKGWPYKSWEDLLFFSGPRRLLKLRKVKKALFYPFTSGFFPNDELPSLYNRAKVFVHPSTEEGASRAVNEALACGIPVVVHKDGAPYIKPEFGVVCESDQEFEAAVMDLLRDDKRREEMGRKGREWIMKNHSAKKLLDAVNILNTDIAADR